MKRIHASLNIRKKAFYTMLCMLLALVFLWGQVFYIQAFRGEELQALAFEQQTRDRLIAPNRGGIYDRNMVGLALTETVASVSVIYAQIRDLPNTAHVLARELQLDEAELLEKISRRVALVRVATQVDKATADRLRELALPGVVIDEDIRRIYPFGSLASQVIGFVGRDNQGIIGLEAKYDSHLRGAPGRILTETDVAGRALEDGRTYRIPPTDGLSLVLTIDAMLQAYAEQTIELLVQEKNALRGVIILMNPQNGAIYALANKPDFDLNAPFTINDPALAEVWDTFTQQEQMNHLNRMWRNFAINDTYEPGSTFKIVTSAAGLAEGLITTESIFTCSGCMTVGGRQIKCWRSPRSHGVQSFIQGVQNSCNPVFMTIGEQLGAELFHDYLMRFGFHRKTGIDLPGEAVGIMYAADKIGPVELATMAFGQSLTITPLQLVSAAATVVNGGYLVTPHVGMRLLDSEGRIVEELTPPRGEQILPAEVSETMRFILESVVSEGTGRRTYIPGFRIGGKTATSQKLPRGSGKYISSIMAFAPAENPQLVALVLIDEPQGAYYGGQVTGPVMQVLLENVLPYLGIRPIYNEAELAVPGTAPVIVPNLRGIPTAEAKKILTDLRLGFDIVGVGDTIIDQFPIHGELVNQGVRILLRAQ
ncbi:MAG: penicillin-binding transpeptidase domain-containing protein [Defluviitaleaceae bacterium]|nr:penicillin-binding transpeptidase domain-containing protein [Defluviitaleaceae bacterium]MCL2275437.1 penicillin-binding transpeptidase domain-containing protein [Defluviitaleaceae bacterium]